MHSVDVVGLSYTSFQERTLPFAGFHSVTYEDPLLGPRRASSTFGLVVADSSVRQRSDTSSSRLRIFQRRQLARQRFRCISALSAHTLCGALSTPPHPVDVWARSPSAIKDSQPVESDIGASVHAETPEVVLAGHDARKRLGARPALSFSSRGTAPHRVRARKRRSAAKRTLDGHGQEARSPCAVQAETFGLHRIRSALLLLAPVFLGGSSSACRHGAGPRRSGGASAGTELLPSAMPALGQTFGAAPFRAVAHRSHLLLGVGDGCAVA